MSYQMLARMSSVEKYFVSQEYKPIVEAARMAYDAGNEVACAAELNKLPTGEQIFDRLIEKLKGKSVYKTLKAIREGKAVDNQVVSMMGLSSLLTHVLIEMKQDRREFGILVPIIFEKMGELVYSL